MFPKTKLEFAQMAARVLVSIQATRSIRGALATHTDIDPDGLPIAVASNVGGQAVAYKAGPYTDAGVERALNWLESRKSEKQETTTK